MSNRINFNKTQGGINTGTFNSDAYVSLIMYTDKLPSGFLSTIAAWETGTSYAIGDEVYDPTSAYYYVCNTAHTASASFATDVANWDEYETPYREFKSLSEVVSAGFAKDSVDYKEIYYQLSEYFRLAPNGAIVLHTAKETGNTYDYAELYNVQKKLRSTTRRQPSGMGIFTSVNPYVIGEGAKIMTQVDKLYTDYKIEVAAVYGSFNYDAYSTLSDIIAVDGKTGEAPKFAHILVQDGDNYGYSLSSTNLGNVGAALAIHTITKASESIGNIENNLAFGNAEMRKPILPFGNISIDELTGTEKTNLAAVNHIFAYREEGGSEVIFYNDKTQTSDADDFNEVNRNRVWARVERDVRTALIPLINARFDIVSDGTGRLESYEVRRIDDIVRQVLIILESQDYYSSFNLQVKNEVNFASTKEVFITIEITPSIIGDKFTIDLGYTLG